MSGSSERAKIYTIKVTSVVTLTVEANNDEEAFEKSGSIAWTLDPDDVEQEIVSIRERNERCVD